MEKRKPGVPHDSTLFDSNGAHDLWKPIRIVFPRSTFPRTTRISGVANSARIGRNSMISISRPEEESTPFAIAAENWKGIKGIAGLLMRILRRPGNSPQILKMLNPFVGRSLWRRSPWHNLCLVDWISENSRRFFRFWQIFEIARVRISLPEAPRGILSNSKPLAWFTFQL